MPLLELHCQYCGHKWEYNTYFSLKDKQLRCSICNDSNIKSKPMEQVRQDQDVFGYNKKEE